MKSRTTKVISRTSDVVRKRVEGALKLRQRNLGSRVSLPLDVIFEIIDHLATSPAPLSYHYDSRVVGTLSALSRVSRDIGRYATTYLYRCVCIHKHRQVSVLVAPRTSSTPPIRSLHVTFENTNRKVLEKFICLLRYVAPTLERLLIVSDLYPWAYTAGLMHDITAEAIAKLPFICELCIVRTTRMWIYQYWADPRPFKVWRALRRVALEGITMTEDVLFFLRRCPNLDILAIPFETMASSLDAIIEKAPSLKKILLIRAVGKKCRSDFPRHTNMTVDEKRSIAALYEGRLVIMEIHAESARHCDQSMWVADHIRDGTLWDSQGPEW